MEREDGGAIVVLPELHELFVVYDEVYFGGALQAAEPLIKFRPSSDLQETLLHEMVHALEFTTAPAARRRLSDPIDRDGHGPFFQMHVARINASNDARDPWRPKKGYHLTVYHSFTNEVDFYLTHVWKCDRCGKVIKRSMNRAPSEKDCRAYRVDGRLWKHDGSPHHNYNRCGDSTCAPHNHIRSCGGVYVKISEPAKTPSVKKQPLKQENAGKVPEESASRSARITAKHHPSACPTNPAKRQTRLVVVSGVCQGEHADRVLAESCLQDSESVPESCPAGKRRRHQDTESLQESDEQWTCAVRGGVTCTADEDEAAVVAAQSAFLRALAARRRERQEQAEPPRVSIVTPDAITTCKLSVLEYIDDDVQVVHERVSFPASRCQGRPSACVKEAEEANKEGTEAGIDVIDLTI
ncbi:SprT-like domain-containing protein Spartan [Porphyridium purpureum]|uniref:SprT-like domain-containing protein Spartan n=1 Tax=Porphyridium purpureum TaxID=35688 RepID=A0A5J4Z250_PORPP|nr:SprT-like domain-containing protein Spartan [Porphyridium purpureum]|eukprot:POR1306..scf208_2